jgi:hypothetical protein
VALTMSETWSLWLNPQRGHRGGWNSPIKFGLNKYLFVDLVFSLASPMVKQRVPSH